MGEPRGCPDTRVEGSTVGGRPVLRERQQPRPPHQILTEPHTQHLQTQRVAPSPAGLPARFPRVPGDQGWVAKSREEP